MQRVSWLKVLTLSANNIYISLELRCLLSMEFLLYRKFAISLLKNKTVILFCVLFLFYFASFFLHTLRVRNVSCLYMMNCFQLYLLCLLLLKYILIWCSMHCSPNKIWPIIYPKFLELRDSSANWLPRFMFFAHSHRGLGFIYDCLSFGKLCLRLFLLLHDALSAYCFFCEKLLEISYLLVCFFKQLS